MSALLAWLARWFDQPDKVLHFAAGAIVAVLLAPMLNELTVLCLVAFVGWAKEVYDKAHADVHTPDGWDAFATLMGALFWLVLWALFGPPIGIS